MSQAGQNNSAAGPVPPTVATSYVTDVNSPAIPALNILNVLGNDTTANDDDGIRTDGSSGSNTLTVQLTNRLQGSGSTVGAVTADIVTFPLTVIGTYDFEFRTAAYNTTTPLGAGYKIFCAVRFDGVNANLCGSPDTIDNEEGAMSACDIDIVVSGANAILRVTGYAAQTIRWGAVGEYTFRGAGV